MNNLVTATVNGTGYFKTEPITKADYGIWLVLDGLDISKLSGRVEIDFSNERECGGSITIPLESNRVEIPHDLILTGRDVYAFLYLIGDDYGRTFFEIQIPVKLRPTREAAK